MSRILIVGGGYSGVRIASLHAGDDVWSSHRPGAAAGTDRGTARLELDLDDDATSQALPEVDRVYYTVPPASDDATDADHRMARFLSLLGGAPELVYFSTTGVYGDCQGEWVDETAEPRPGNDRSCRRLAAEQMARAWSERVGAKLTVLRVAGIYGPGRLPLEKVRQGSPVLDPAEAGWSNRIHVDDLAAAAVACAGHGAGGIYNVADGRPSTTAEYYDALAELLALPRPQRVSRGEAEQYFSARALEFMQDSKRVQVDKLLAVPGFALRYPDFRCGLEASLEAGSKS